MKKRTCVIGFVVGAALGIAAPAAHAAFGVANSCVNPVNTSCWVAGLYNHDYTGMNDHDYLGPPAQQSGGHPFIGVTDFQHWGGSTVAPLSEDPWQNGNGYTNGGPYPQFFWGTRNGIRGRDLDPSR